MSGGGITWYLEPVSYTHLDVYKRQRYMSLDHVTSPEMLLRQHHEIFTALEKRDAEAVEKAMSIHLHEISESVLLIRQENRDWFSEE